MSRRGAIFIAMGLLLCAGVAVSTPAQVPDSAYLEISAFNGKSYRVNISGTKALYQTGPRVATEWEEISLSPPKVAKYFLSIRSIGVFSWQDEYRCNMFDGTGWHFEVIGGEKYFASSGSNDFPPRFNELLKLTSELVGRPITANISPCPEGQK